MAKARGFTIVEMLVVIAVMAILLSVAVPGLRVFLQNQRASSQANELVTAFNYARAEALKRAQSVTVCPIANPLAATPTCAASNVWITGWMVFVDGGAMGSTTLNYVERLRIFPALQGTPTLNRTAGARQFIRFGGDSRIDTGTGSVTYSFTSSIEGCRGDRGRQLLIAPTGRVTVNRIACPT